MSISSLSTEILLRIVSHFQPEDAILFSQTCRRYHQICEDQILWRELAYQMCFSNMILIPHDLDKLSLKELKHLATSPGRTLKLLQAHRQANKVKKDDKTKHLAPRYTTIVVSEAEAQVDQIVLVPGGRYMVTVALDVFNLWDLHALPAKQAVSLKQWTHPTTDGSLLTYAPTSDQRSLILLVTSSSPSPYVTVYKISLTSAGGVELASVVGPLDGDIDGGPFVCCTVLGNRFAYIFNSVMCIWDYEQNLFVRWRTSAPTGECQEIVFHGDRVWLLCNDVLMVWSIPEFMTLEMYSSKPAELIAPELTIAITRPPKSYRTVLKHSNTSWISSQDWYNNCGSPLASFDIVWASIRVEKVATYPLLSIYASEPSTRAIQSTSTFVMPILGWDTLPIPRVIDLIRRCGDFFVKPICSFRMTSLNLIVSPALTVKAEDTKSFRVVLPLESKSAGRGCLQEDENALFDAMHSQVFDPVAGRGCRIYERNQRSVLVWDYLK